MNTEKQKITMDGKYKYRNGEPARVLCMDYAIDGCPAISMDKNGVVRAHRIDGSFLWRVERVEDDYDLIPDIPIWEGELWVHPEKSAHCVLEKGNEKQWNEMGYRKIKVKEVTDEL